MYIWIGLVFDKDTEKYIRDNCKSVNVYNLSEKSFTLPQHISLKTSFYCDNYIEVIDYIKKELSSTKYVDVTIDGITKINNAVIWLDIKETKELRELHNLLNTKLKEKYNIGLSGFDGESFHFHSTLIQDKEISDEHNILVLDLKKRIKLPLKALITKVCFGISLTGEVGTYQLKEELILKDS